MPGFNAAMMIEESQFSIIFFRSGIHLLHEMHDILLLVFVCWNRLPNGKDLTQYLPFIV
jgi:hypothetical protein